MPDYTNIIERRTSLLADHITTRQQILDDALMPEANRPAFHKQLQKPEALRFWQQHRYDSLGQRVLNNMSPDAVMELDQALSQANESAGMYADVNANAGIGEDVGMSEGYV